MLSTLRPVLPLLLSHCMLISANGMFSSLLGLRSRFEGFSTETTGLIMSGTFVGMLLGALYAVRIVAYVGHIRAFAVLASVMSVAVLSHVLFIDPGFWFVLRVLTGFCIAGLAMIVESWLNAQTVNERRGQVMSAYMIVNYLGYAIGQFLILLDDPKETELFIIASIVLSLALVPILMTRAKAPTPEHSGRLSVKKLFQISPLGLIIVFGSGMLNAPVNSLGAVFGREAGLELSDISVLVACFVGGGMLLQYPIGRLSDKLDRRTVILGVTIVVALLALMVVWALGQATIVLFIAAAIYGSFAYTLYPLGSAQFNDLADSSIRVQVAAGVMMAYGVGAIIGPAISAQFMGYMGPEGLFYYIAILTSCLTVFTLLRKIKRAPTQSNMDKKSVFLPISGISFASRQLYNAAYDSIIKDKHGEKKVDQDQ